MKDKEKGCGKRIKEMFPNLSTHKYSCGEYSTILEKAKLCPDCKDKKEKNLK